MTTVLWVIGYLGIVFMLLFVLIPYLLNKKVKKKEIINQDNNLKTLREIKGRFINGKIFVNYDEMIKEINKWIHFLGETIENENTEENVAVVEWIKYFFNIGEKK